MKLPKAFYRQKNVVAIAKELLGKQLVTTVDGMTTAGLIVETEAYSWKEKGCHAYNGKTNRNAVMFEEGGRSYVYLCYGMYNLFNVVTNVKGVAEAVLIRALQPTKGMDIMQLRRGPVKDHQLTSGPGKLTMAMGINRTHNGTLLRSKELWIEEGINLVKSQIVTAKRIGIDYAGIDAELPWRFYLRDNVWVSKK